MKFIWKGNHPSRKSNTQFMLMSAIGIIMVVDGHSWNTVNIGTSIFPYNSFFMGMFIFISGYFYNADRAIEHPRSYLGRKVKTLFLPYLAWWFVYLLIGKGISWISDYSFAPAFSFYGYFIGPLVCGEFGGLNGPAYFVPILFYTLCLYTLLRKACNGFWNENIFLGISVLIGAFVVKYSISINSDFEYNTAFMMLMKVLFSMQFFQLGVAYRACYERRFNRLDTASVVAFLLIAISVVKHRFNNINWTLNRLNFEPGLADSGYLGYAVPFLTTVLGIAFWLEITKVFSRTIENNHFIQFVSDHTFGIMEHHIFCMVILNMILRAINGIVPVNGLDVQKLSSTAWYRYTWGGSEFYVFYFIFGLFGSCLICWFVDKLKNKSKMIAGAKPGND